MIIFNQMAEKQDAPNDVTLGFSSTQEISKLFAYKMSINEDKANRVITKILHAIRNDSPSAIADQIEKQLPNDLRPLYNSNMTVKLNVGKLTDTQALITEILIEDKKSGNRDFANTNSVLQSASVFFELLKTNLPEENYRNITQILSSDIIQGFDA